MTAHDLVSQEGAGHEAQESGAEAAAGSTPAALCQGYVSVTGQGRSTAMEGREENVDAQIKTTYKVCLDTQTLTQTLEVDQSLSVDFGGGGVSEKTQFVRSLNVTTWSISIVVFTKHVKGAKTLRDYSLKSGVTLGAGDAGLTAFFREYGDSFVTSLSVGGEYYAVYTFWTQTREEQTGLAAEMDAHGIFDGVSVNATLQTKLNSFVKTTSTRVSFKQQVTGISELMLPQSDQIIDFALKFPTIPLTAPTIVQMQTTGYEFVGGIGERFDPIARNKRYFVGASATGGLTGDLVKLQQLLDQINILQGIYRFYNPYFKDEKLDRVKGQVLTDQKTIRRQMDEYELTPTAKFEAPSLSPLAEGTPVLEYTRDPKILGNLRDKDRKFYDVDPGHFLQTQTRVTEIRMRAGKDVNRLITTYANVDKTWTTKNGGDAGSPTSVLTIPTDQSVTKVDGYWNKEGKGQYNYINWLRFETSGGRSLSAGERDSKRKGEAGTITVPPPQKAEDPFVLGFDGSIGRTSDGKDVLYSITVVCASFKPAKWVM